MGYPNAGRFLETIEYLKLCDSQERYSILEFGDQTLLIQKEDITNIFTFLSTFGAGDKASKYEKQVGERIFVGDVYKDAGIEYHCLDVNGNNSAIPLDLNRWPNPLLDEACFQRFDLVANYGTTEHVCNQINAFAITHYLVKPGGIILHHIPMLHYSNHAMVCVTPLFFKKLIDLNRYEILNAEWRSHMLNQAITFHYHPSLAFLKGFVEIIEKSTASAMGTVLLRKQDSTSFVPPIDIAVSGEKEQSFLAGYIDDYAHPFLPVNSSALVGELLAAKSVTEEWIRLLEADCNYHGRSSFHISELDQESVKVLRREDTPHFFDVVAVTESADGKVYKQV